MLRFEQEVPLPRRSTAPAPPVPPPRRGYPRGLRVMLAGCALMIIRKIQLRAVRGNVSVFVPVVRLLEKLLCGFCMVFFLRLRVSFQRNQQRLDILTDIGYTASETKLGSPERRRAP